MVHYDNRVYSHPDDAPGDNYPEDSIPPRRLAQALDVSEDEPIEWLGHVHVQIYELTKELHDCALSIAIEHDYGWGHSPRDKVYVHPTPREVDFPKDIEGPIKAAVPAISARGTNTMEAIHRLKEKVDASIQVSTRLDESFDLPWEYRERVPDVRPPGTALLVVKYWGFRHEVRFVAVPKSKWFEVMLPCRYPNREDYYTFGPFEEEPSREDCVRARLRLARKAGMIDCPRSMKFVLPDGTHIFDEEAQEWRLAPKGSYNYWLTDGIKSSAQSSDDPMRGRW